MDNLEWRNLEIEIFKLLGELADPKKSDGQRLKALVQQLVDAHEKDLEEEKRPL